MLFRSDTAQAAAIKSFQKDNPSGSTIPTQATTTDLQSIRYETMQATINRSPAIFLSPAEVDSAALRCIRILWNQADWLFRRRETVMTLATDSTVSQGRQTFMLGIKRRLDVCSTA